MRRPLTANELNAFRTWPQRANWYMAVHRPASVFSSKIAATPDTYPASAVTIDAAFNEGDATLASKNMTVLIGSLPGASDEGKVRLRDTISGTVVPIAESGCAVNRYTAGLFVTIMKRFDPVPIMPKYNTAASQWRMDYNKPHTDELQNYGPLAIMGPPVAGFLDSGSMSASFIGGSSPAFSSTISSGQWEFPDGQSESRIGTEASVVNKTFTGASPNGDYFTFAATDAKGNSQISRRLIFAFNDRTGPAEVVFTQIQGGLHRGGYNGSVRVLSGGTGDDFPDGAEIVIFEEASYAGMASTIGGNYPHRENIVYRGFISDDTTQINPFSGEVVFKIVGLHEILKKTYSKDIFHAYATPPTGTSEWIEADNLCVDYAALDLVKHRSTIAEITDFHVASGVGVTGKIAFQDLPKSNLWTQLKTNYDQRGFRGHVATDLQGTIYATEDVLVNGASAALPLQMKIQPSDRRGTVVIPHPHYDKNALVELYSVASTTPVGARSPGGDAYGYFGGTVVHERGLVVHANAATAQHTLTTWSGNVRAKLNNPFPKVRVPLAGNLRIDSVPQHRIQMSLSPTENVRGLNWSNKQFLPTGLNLMYDAEGGVVLTNLELESIVDGKGGSAITFAKVVPMPPTQTPIPPTPPFAGGSLIAFNDPAGTYRYSTAWESMNGTLAGNDIQDLTGGKSGTNNVVYKGVTGSILKTEDLGVTWTDVAPGADPDGSAASSVDYIMYKADPTDNTKHYWLARKDIGGTWYSWLLKHDSGASSYSWVNLPSATVSAGTSVASYSPVYKLEPTVGGAGGDTVQGFNQANAKTKSVAYFDASNFAVVYNDSASAGKVLYMRSWNLVSDTSLNAGAAYDVHDDYNYFHHVRHVPGTSVVVLINGVKDFDGAGSMQVYGRLFQNNAGSIVSGTQQQISNHTSTTPTQVAIDGGVAAPNSSEAYFAWNESNSNLIRGATISGVTLTPRATIYNFADASSDAVGTDYLNADSLDGGKIVVSGQTHSTADASMTSWIFDLQGASMVSYGPFNERIGACPVINPQNQFADLLGMHRNIFITTIGSKNGTLFALPASVSFAPTTSVNYGPTTLIGSSGLFGGQETLTKIDASNFMITGLSSGSNGGIQTVVVNVNGLSINTGPATDTIPGDWEATAGPTVTFLRPTLAAIAFTDASADNWMIDALTARLAAGAGGQTAAKGLGMDISGTGETLYTTYSDNSNLKLEVTDTTGMTQVTSVDLGVGSWGQTASKVAVAYPTTIPGNDNFCYIHGRMGDPAGISSNPAHIIKTENRGTSFTLLENSFGDDHAGAMGRIGDTGFALRNVRGVLSGFYILASGNNLQSTVPFAVNPGGIYTTSDGYIILGASTPENYGVRYSVSPFTRWYLLKGYPKTGGVTGLTLLT